MVFQWFSNGFPKLSLWFFSGFPKVFPSFPRCLPRKSLVSACFPGGLSEGELCCDTVSGSLETVGVWGKFAMKNGGFGRV